MAKKIALLIGVGEFGAGLKPLHCPANGVAALREVLENPQVGGFEVIPLVNPDVGTMQRQVGEVFGRAQKDDLLLFYFTGHGVKDISGDFYFATRVTELFPNGTLNIGTAVDAKLVLKVMANSLCRRQVAILDCCFSGAFPDGFLAMDDGQVDIRGQLGGEGRAVLTAATSTKYALEQEGEDLSVYTRYLVEGLRTGAAAPEGASEIAMRPLHDYVREKVQTAAPAMKPEIYAARDGEQIVIARAAATDPVLRYRKAVEKYIEEGEIGLVGRRILDRLRLDLGLGEEQAAEIEAAVLKPHRERRDNLREFGAAVQEAVQHYGGLPDRVLGQLREFQRMLNLRDEDVEPMLAKVPKLVESPTPPVAEKTPSKPSVAETDVPQQQKQSRPTFSFETVTLQVKTETVISEQTGFLGIGKKQVSQERRTLISQKKSGSAEYFTEDLGNGITLEMVSIPAGEFLMGAAQGEEGASNDEYPQHRVRVPAFWMGKFAVTQAQWKAVAQLPKVQRDLEADPSRFKGADLPVERVSWWDAVEFCDRLSRKTGKPYRLPTEAEWEYACRAGTTTPFHFGETLSTDVANYDGNYTYSKGQKGQYRQKTTPVGTFPPNGFGLYDMHGNVWEWCLDHWHDSYEGAPIDGSAWLEPNAEPNAHRVLRGGSWSYYPRFCRSADRYYFSADCRFNLIGFRVVYSVAPGLL